MSIKKIVQEATDKNVLGFEQAVKEELSKRIALALEAKMGCSGDKKNDYHPEEESSQ